MQLNNRGDTIIEVMLAMGLLSAILFTSWGIINRSTQISLAARQRVVMVNQIKEQAEIIKFRYANTQLKQNFLQELGAESTGTETIDPIVCKNSRSPEGVINGQDPVRAFHLNEEGGITASPKNLTQYTNAKVWAQAHQTDAYTDFYIRACWQTVGGVENEDNTQLILRLNR